MSPRALRRQLLLSTTLIAGALGGYGRRANGACAGGTLGALALRAWTWRWRLHPPAPASTVAGVPLARDSALVDAGLDLAMGRDATFGVGYSGQVGDDVADHAVTGRFDWRF